MPSWIAKSHILVCQCIWQLLRIAHPVLLEKMKLSRNTHALDWRLNVHGDAGVDRHWCAGSLGFMMPERFLRTGLISLAPDVIPPCRILRRRWALTCPSAIRGLLAESGRYLQPVRPVILFWRGLCSPEHEIIYHFHRHRGRLGRHPHLILPGHLRIGRGNRLSRRLP